MANPRTYGKWRRSELRHRQHRRALRASARRFGVFVGRRALRRYARAHRCTARQAWRAIQAAHPSDYEFRVAYFTLSERNFGKLARLAASSPLAKAASAPRFRESAAAARRRRKL